MNAPNPFELHPPMGFDSLAQACAQARAQWPGLPAVAQACIESLGLAPAEVQAKAQEKVPANFQAKVQTPASDDLAAMLHFVQAVAQSMEALGRSWPEGPEPAYHNRLHTADVLLTLTALLHGQQASHQPEARPWAAACLAAAVAHDYGHPGGTNAQPFELESRSWQALAAHTPALPQPWRGRIESLILHTDPLTVQANHLRVASQAFDWTLPWCQVLLNEADILVSASARFGPGLSQALAQEWQRAGVAAHAVVATPAGRLAFLRSVRFSSPAALALGLPEQVQQQLF